MIDSKSLEQPPRAVRTKGEYLGTRNAVAVVAVLIALFFAYQIQNTLRRDFQLAQHGVQTNGRVIGNRVQSGKQESFYLKIEYSQAGREVHREFHVTPEMYVQGLHDPTLGVYVDPADPTNARIEPISPKSVWFYCGLWTLFWIGGVAGAGFLLKADASAAKEERRRVADWPLGHVSITEVSSTTSRSDVLTASGTLVDLEGRSRTVNGLTLSGPVKLGQEVPVLYDPDSDRAFTLDSFVRVEPCLSLA